MTRGSSTSSTTLDRLRNVRPVPVSGTGLGNDPCRQAGSIRHAAASGAALCRPHHDRKWCADPVRPAAWGWLHVGYRLCPKEIRSALRATFGTAAARWGPPIPSSPLTPCIRTLPRATKRDLLTIGACSPRRSRRASLQLCRTQPTAALSWAHACPVVAYQQAAIGQRLHVGGTAPGGLVLFEAADERLAAGDLGTVNAHHHHPVTGLHGTVPGAVLRHKDRPAVAGWKHRAGVKAQAQSKGKACFHGTRRSPVLHVAGRRAGQRRQLMKSRVMRALTPHRRSPSLSS
jgi:hypothetical protein